MAGYLVPTSQGKKGPFTSEQICRLVDQGKLPRTVKLIDTEYGRAVSVQEVYEAGTVDPSLRLDLPLDDAGESPPIERPRGRLRPARARVSRGRRRSFEPGRRSRAARGTRPARGRERDDRRRPARRSTTPVGLIITLVVVVLGLGVGVFFLVNRGGSDSLLGTWTLDTDATVDSAPKLRPMAESEKVLGRAMLKAFAQFLEFHIDESTITTRVKAGNVERTKTDTYTARELGDGNHELTVTEQNGEVSLLRVKMQGDRMRMTIASTGKVMVLRRR